MKNENFKIINERWDSYVKQQEPLNENAVQFTNDLLASGAIANYNAIYGLILMGLKWRLTGAQDLRFLAVDFEGQLCTKNG